MACERVLPRVTSERVVLAALAVFAVAVVFGPFIVLMWREAFK